MLFLKCNTFGLYANVEIELSAVLRPGCVIAMVREVIVHRCNQQDRHKAALFNR